MIESEIEILKKGQVYEGVVERYTFPNKGYVKVEDREICIKGALKGQKVRFSIKKLRKGGGEGRLLDVLERSALEDKQADCPHFGVCGGCAYQTMSYEHQLALKEEQVRGLLEPVILTADKKEDAFCASFESFAYKNLGYQDYKELGPGEIVVLTHKNCVTLVQPGKDMKICTFLWVYYGYPASSYEGISVEQMRYNCGAKMAERDNVKPDIVAGVPDSGIAHAVGYANESGIPFSRPFIKYTPTWPRSFMPTIQSQRNLIAKMKLLAVEDLIKDKSLLLIDDSIVRGTQLRETTEYLFDSGAKEVHIRPACPPLVYGCKYLNFSRSSSEMDLITRRVIERLENGNVTDEVLQEYTDPDSEKYEKMVDEICKELHFTSLRFNRLDDMLEACGVEKCKLCTYCWDGKE